MKQLRLEGIILLGFFGAIAMERRPPADPAGRAGLSVAVVLANKLYEEERFFGSGDLSPRSEHEKFYQNMLERGVLEARDTTQAKYRLALVYAAKNRPTCDIIPLLEAVSADGTVDRRALIDARYRLVNLYSDAQDLNYEKRCKLLQAIVVAGDRLQPEILADIKRKLAFALIEGPRRNCDGELATTLFQEAFDSGWFIGDALNKLQNGLTRLKIIAQERNLCHQLIKIKELDKGLLAYAQYKLAVMYTYGIGLSRNRELADALLREVIASGQLNKELEVYALHYKAVCARAADREEIELSLAGLTGNKLARQQCQLANVYRDDRETYGDKRALELLQTAIESGALTSGELGDAQYQLACLYDECPDVSNDKLAREFFGKALAAANFTGDHAADAQYRLARILVLGVDGNSNFLRAQELLRKAISSGHLTPKQLTVAREIVGTVGSEAERRDKRAHNLEMFDRSARQEMAHIDPQLVVSQDALNKLAQSLITARAAARKRAEIQAKLEAAITALQKKINGACAEPQQLVEIYFQVAFLQYTRAILRGPSLVSFGELRKIVVLLNHVQAAGFWTKERTKLIDGMIAQLASFVEKPANEMDDLKAFVAKDRSGSITSTSFDDKLDRKLYEYMLDMGDLEPAAKSIVHCRLLGLGSKMGKVEEALAHLPPYLPLKTMIESKILERDLQITWDPLVSDMNKYEAFERLLRNKQLEFCDKLPSFVRYKYGCKLSKRKDIKSRSELRLKVVGLFEEAINLGQLAQYRIEKAQKKLAWLRSLYG